jgi:hypothetical protein
MFMRTKGKFYKLQNWFESNQRLFAKVFKQKIKKKEGKENRNWKRAPGQVLAQTGKLAHGPAYTPPESVSSFFSPFADEWDPHVSTDVSSTLVQKSRPRTP